LRRVIDIFDTESSIISLNFKSFYIFILLLAAQSFFLPGQAQVTDFIPDYRNIIRVNLSNQMLFGIRNNVVGYERILKHNQSISVNMGRFRHLMPIRGN